jgi:hypothetical protein
LAVATKRLGHLFPDVPQRPGYFKRRRRLAETLEWLMAMFASQSPGFDDDLLLIDSTPVECARSRETVKRSALGDAADYGWCASQSRYVWGFRLHAICAPDGTPRALELCSPKLDEREVGLALLERCRLQGPITLIGNKGYAGRDFGPEPASGARPSCALWSSSAFAADVQPQQKRSQAEALCANYPRGPRDITVDGVSRFVADPDMAGWLLLRRLVTMKEKPTFREDDGETAGDS